MSKEVPKTLSIKKKGCTYTVSFCFQDFGCESEILTSKEHLAYLKKATREELEEKIIASDGGAVVPSWTSDNTPLGYTFEEHRSMRRAENTVTPTSEGSQKDSGAQLAIRN